MPDLNAIGSVVVSRSRSIKQKSAAIKGTSSSSDLKLDATALQTPAATSPMNSCCSYTQRHSWHLPVLPPTPLANLNLYKLVEDATPVFLMPSHAPKVAWLKEMSLVKITKPIGQYPSIVNDYVMQLVEGIFVGRLFFDYVSNDVNNEDIDYSVAYVQPSLITSGCISKTRES